AAALSDEIAALDLAPIADARGLDLKAWRALSEVRQSAALRRWLSHELSGPVPATLVERLLRETDLRATQRWPVAAGELHGYRGLLSWSPRRAGDGGGEPVVVDLSRPGLHTIAGWDGAFRVARVARGGIAAAQAARLELRARRPGDRFQAGPARPPRSLKLQYQAAGVPASGRVGPIACSGDLMVFVPALGIDARAVATPGVVQVSLAWLPSGRAAKDSMAIDAG
ncbi:MAG TPA: TilS substrate C-terminal domain-containing protein, partial [Caldimonas sp.]